MRPVFLLLPLLAMSWAPQAHAEKGAITIAEVTIVGRVQKPVAAVDVSKLRAKITLSELKQPFVDRIEEVIRHPPF